MCTLSLIAYIYIQIYICLYVWKIKKMMLFVPLGTGARRLGVWVWEKIFIVPPILLNLLNFETCEYNIYSKNKEIFKEKIIRVKIKW